MKALDYRIRLALSVTVGLALFLNIVASSSSGFLASPTWHNSIVPVPTVYSPLPTPTPRAKASEKAQWRFAHDVFDKHGSKKPKDQAIGSDMALSAVATTGGYLPDWTRTSDFMVGRVVVGIILPESNGTILPSTENWDANEISFVTTEITQALQLIRADSSSASVACFTMIRSLA
jgi:hypothetical protein